MVAGFACSLSQEYRYRCSRSSFKIDSKPFPKPPKFYLSNALEYGELRLINLSWKNDGRLRGVVLVVLIFSLFQRKKTADGFFELNIRCFKQNRVQEKKNRLLTWKKEKKNWETAIDIYDQNRDNGGKPLNRILLCLVANLFPLWPQVKI